MTHQRLISLCGILVRRHNANITLHPHIQLPHRLPYIFRADVDAQAARMSQHNSEIPHGIDNESKQMLCDQPFCLHVRIKRGGPHNRVRKPKVFLSRINQSNNSSPYRL